MGTCQESRIEVVKNSQKKTRNLRHFSYFSTCLLYTSGTIEMREMLDLGLTIDERLADGYYYSKTIRLLKKLLENPELLETPANQEVEY